jgi:uncharacterized protein (TIGR03000 family)
LFTIGGALLVAAALLALTPGFAAARGGGGFHGGGVHGGGFHGGFHAGGFHSGGYHFGGYGGGFHYHPYSHPYAWGYHHGWDHYRPWYGGYYPAFGYDPAYSLYPYDDSYLGSGSVDEPGYTSFYSPPPPPSSDSASARATPADTRAHITADVPAGAQLWFEGTLTSSTGSVRQFESPPLTPGSQYTYTVRARWSENGHEMTQTQQAQVTAGAHIDLRFPLPARTGSQAAAAPKR